jgi:hypothetical protein
MSRTTVLSLADMGYAVDPDAADPFDLGSAFLALGLADAGVPMGEDVLDLPLRLVPAGGPAGSSR